MRLSALVLVGAAWAIPARADFLDDVRRTFQKDIPRTFEQDIPRFFGAKPKEPPTTPPPTPPKARANPPAATPRR